VQKKSYKKKQAFGIQIIFQETHQKKSVYELLYKHLGLDPSSDELTIYLITQPKHIRGYIVNTFKKLSVGFEEEDMPNLRFRVVKSDWMLPVLK